MTRLWRITVGALVWGVIASGVIARAASFEGEWRTPFGVVTLKQAGDAVTGSYGDDGKFTIKGTASGLKLTFDYDEGRVRGVGHWTLDDSGCAFAGNYNSNDGRGGEWVGWRPEAEAIKGKRADVGGVWLTDLGLMQLEQTGEKVKGRYALGGASQIEGTVTGRRADFSYQAFRAGKGWFDVAAEGSKFSGAAVSDGFSQWYGWRGRRAPEFARYAKLVAGKIVDGSTKGLLTYSVRAPEGYREGGGKKWPAILILHGSNMSGRAYVNTIASAWPDVAKDFLIIGINGELPSAIGEEPAFNFTYVNYMGRSTLKGFPGTDRESPALVSEAMAELRAAYPVQKYFVGGHSQGGFLTYSLLMNFPEQIAGAFPISAGVMFQCEPDVFVDEKLRKAQRAVPLAIVHGKQEAVVGFDSGEYAATVFGEAGWPAFRFFVDDGGVNGGAGHRFGLLPIGEVIRWLAAQASDDPNELLDFAEQRWKEKGYRDAIAAVNRVAAMKLDDAAKQRLDRLSVQIDAKARVRVEELLAKMKKNDANDWIDPFLAYRDDFEFAPASREVMQAFAELRATHEGPAKKAMADARAALGQGKRDEGYAKYQEIVEKYYAASSYRNVKRWLAERK